MSSPSSIERIESLSEAVESFVDSTDLYVLMIDLCGSTAIKQFCRENDLPDSMWIIRQRFFLARSAKIIRRYKGTIVKTIGDEVMGTYRVDSTPGSIVDCCTEVFQSFGNLRQYNRGIFRISAKASIDFGECVDGDVLDNGIFDPIGNAVDRCARMAKFVGKNEIAISEDVYRALSPVSEEYGGYTITSHSEDLSGLGQTQFFVLAESTDA